VVRSELAALGLDQDVNSAKTNALANAQRLPRTHLAKKTGPLASPRAEPAKGGHADADRAVWDLYLNSFDAGAHQRLGTCLVEAGELESGHGHLLMALALGPEQPELRSQRVLKALRRTGETYVSQARWQEAAEDFLHLSRLAPQDSLISMQAAALLLMTDNRVAYRRLCSQMLARFRETTNSYVADRTLKACLMGGEAIEDHGALAKLARVAVEQGKSDRLLPYFQFTRGLSEYRQGRYAAAQEWFERSRNKFTPPHLRLDALNALFGAMALHHLGQTEEAAHLVDLAQPVIDNGFAADLKIPGSIDWHDWLFCRLALNEATKVLQARPARESKESGP
jgi:tetratricopeptide (TPR) repeat protein